MDNRETSQLQQAAEKVNLGPHQHLIEAQDEEGRAGRWVVHRPTVAEEIRIGVLFAQLRTPPATPTDPLPKAVEIDDDRYNLAYMIATLGVVTDMRPEWFPKDPGECRDSDLIITIFGLFEVWRQSFRRRLPDEGGSDSGAS